MLQQRKGYPSFSIPPFFAGLTAGSGIALSHAMASARLAPLFASTMTAPDFSFATIEQLQPLLAGRKISPVMLAELFLSRIAQLDVRLNAFRTVTPERAMEDARRAERELRSGHCRGPLHGIPITLKDNIATRGIRTTAGSAIRGDDIPEEDATVVVRLRRAGAVLLGKTNLHEFAYGITSENPHYGATHNPWSLERIPGGSSGGSAAAVAAGLCVASVGTDTGGSVRIPAALCGVVGLKPTFGRVSVYGVFPLAPSFDHVGVLARSVADAATLLSAISGRDRHDPTTLAPPRMHWPQAKARKSGKIRLGMPQEHFWTRLDPEVRRRAEAAVQAMAKQGAAIEEISLPATTSAVDAATTVALVEATRVHELAGYFPARAAEYAPDGRERLEQGGTSPRWNFCRRRR